jgi:hypothetical protein
MQIFETAAAADGNDRLVLKKDKSAVKTAVTDQAPGISLQA